MDWDRLAAQMIREMIRQCLQRPAEFLTFGQLAFRIPGADRDLLYVFASTRPELFLLCRNEHALKLHMEAVEKILEDGPDAIIAAHQAPQAAPVTNHTRCEHFSSEELTVDLLRGSLSSQALTRACCWAKVCRLRNSINPPIDQGAWREICATRGYLLARQNPRGFQLPVAPFVSSLKGLRAKLCDATQRFRAGLFSFALRARKRRMPTVAAS